MCHACVNIFCLLDIYPFIPIVVCLGQIFNPIPLPCEQGQCSSFPLPGLKIKFKAIYLAENIFEI
jgi:hypothetical protein